MNRRDFLSRVRNIGLAIAAGQSGMEMFDSSMINVNGNVWMIDYLDVSNSVFTGRSVVAMIEEFQKEVIEYRVERYNQLYYGSFNTTLAER